MRSSLRVASAQAVFTQSRLAVTVFRVNFAVFGPESPPSWHLESLCCLHSESLCSLYSDWLCRVWSRVTAIALHLGHCGRLGPACSVPRRCRATSATVLWTQTRRARAGRRARRGRAAEPWKRNPRRPRLAVGGVRARPGRAMHSMPGWREGGTGPAGARCHPRPRPLGLDPAGCPPRRPSSRPSGRQGQVPCTPVP